MAAPRTATMLVRFTKQAAAARADTLDCVRADGTTTRTVLPRQGVLPPTAVQYVVEVTLGWRDGFFGQVAHGAPLRRRAAAPAGGRQDREQAPVLHSEALAECLQSEQWGGASDPGAFAAKLAAACRRRGVKPPELSPDDLTRVRAALREFGAAWRPLNPGSVLERRF
jgi:hypothetical protein